MHQKIHNAQAMLSVRANGIQELHQGFKAVANRLAIQA
jgi:hypothetical protein